MRNAKLEIEVFMREVIVGLDLGHSAVKMTFDGKGTVNRHIFPALSAPAIQIRNETEAKLAAEETVSVNGRNFFVGKTAALQGKTGLSSGLSENWIASDEHSALIAMAKKVVDKEGAIGKRVYILGLPVVHFESQREQLKKIAEQQLGKDCEIRILPQPMGAYQALMLNRNGSINKNRSFVNESWGVVDVGYYSTDFILMMEGRWVESSSGGCGGVRMATEHLQKILEGKGIQRDLVDMEKALRDGNIRHFGKQIDLSKEIKESTDLVAAKVVDMANQLMGAHVHSLDGVLIAGGGAEIILSALKERWPHVITLDDDHSDKNHKGSRYVVSEGYYRWGRNALMLRQISK